MLTLPLPSETKTKTAIFRFIDFLYCIKLVTSSQSCRSCPRPPPLCSSCRCTAWGNSSTSRRTRPLRPVRSRAGRRQRHPGTVVRTKLLAKKNQNDRNGFKFGNSTEVEVLLVSVKCINIKYNTRVWLNLMHILCHSPKFTVL